MTFETARTFDRGRRPRNGSIMAPGPTVAGGMLFVGSGWRVLGTPGKCFAFGVGDHATQTRHCRLDVGYQGSGLIVGGSLVDFLLRCAGASRGALALAVEHHRGTAIHPRAAHARSARWRSSAPSPWKSRSRKSAQQFVQNGGVVAVETLVGGAKQEFIADLNSGPGRQSLRAHIPVAGRARTALEPAGT